MIPWIDDAEPWPPTAQALGPESDAPGLLCAGGHLSPERLESAYRLGIFPWYSPGQPPLWWAPDPRMVLLPEHFKLHRSLRKTLHAFVLDARCELRFNTSFERVIEACATTPRGGVTGSWIVPELMQAYTAWHRLGRAHSLETWVDGELVGGLYGVRLGAAFFGESMFAWRSDASKIAFAGLVAWARSEGIELIDCQQRTQHLASLGAAELPRLEFEARLKRALGQASSAQAPRFHPALWREVLPERGA